MNRREVVEFAAWAWAKGGADVLAALVNRGAITAEYAAAFAAARVKSLDDALAEHGTPPHTRIDALHQFDDLLTDRHDH